MRGTAASYIRLAYEFSNLITSESDQRRLHSHTNIRRELTRYNSCCISVGLNQKGDYLLGRFD